MLRQMCPCFVNGPYHRISREFLRAAVPLRKIELFPHRNITYEGRRQVEMPQLTLDAIQSRATAQSFTRGKQYYQDGAIYNTTRRGNELEGWCSGSDYSPYRVRVTLTADGFVGEASCTCLYDWGGDCKHIVALLLTYLNKPQLFEEREPVKDLLESRTKEQLIALIRQMIEQYPDLQTLIDRPFPGQQPANQPVDPKTFRRELRQAFKNANPWDDDFMADRTLSSIMRAAQQFQDAGDWRSACAIDQVIVEEALDHIDELMDDEGLFIELINQVLDRLAASLRHDEVAQDDTLRRSILDQMLYAFIKDIDLGGVGLAEDAMPETLLAHVKREELPAIREQIETAQRNKVEQTYSEWGVEIYEELLVQLDALDNVDPEVTLQRLREQEMYSLLFEKLLDMGRVDEAVDVIETYLTGPHERFQTLPALAAAGQEDAAIRIARETIDKQFNDSMTRWLAARYKARGDREASFELHRLWMQEKPHENVYVELKQAAEAVGKWDSVRPAVIEDLERSKQFDVLTRIYLHDEDWNAAWRTVARVPDNDSAWWLGETLKLLVADRSRHALPERAIPVYVDAARRLIDQRTRSDYAQAAQYLEIVHELYDQLDDEELWLDLIEGIREEFRRLPALQDELNKAGL